MEPADLDPDLKARDAIAKERRNGRKSMATLQEIVDEVNRRAVGRPIGGLQDWRKANRGLGRKAAHKVFGRIRTGDYVFHIGGRDELQFNIGLDEPVDGASLRYGVAFSFELSQTLPDIEPLRPKVPFFNEHLRANPESSNGLSMWHYTSAKKYVGRYAPMAIGKDLVAPNVFVFLGALGHIDNPDYDAILDTLDRLLPLYRFVESGDGQRVDAAETWEEPPLRMRPASPTGWTTANLAARTVDVDLRHRALQARLCEELQVEHPDGYVGEEHPTPDGGRIDVVADTREGRILYEIKTAATARGCIREALGQVLDYARWSGDTRVTKVVVVGAAAITPAEDAYIARLNRSFPVLLEYRRVVLEGG